MSLHRGDIGGFRSPPKRVLSVWRTVVKLLSTSHEDKFGVLSVTKRYRLEVDGVRVAIRTKRSFYEDDVTYFVVDFWTPHTRYDPRKLQKWEKPNIAFGKISSEISKLCLEAMDNGDTVQIMATCHKRLRIYRRVAEKVLKERPLKIIEEIPGSPGKGEGFFILDDINKM